MEKFECGQPYKEIDIREVGDLSIASLDIGYSNAVNYLARQGITKVSQLPGLDTKKLKSTIWTYDGLRKSLLERGIFFVDDKKLFAQFGLDDEIAFAPLETVKGLDSRAKKALLLSKKYIVFGDLVTTPYSVIEETRNIGKQGLQSIEKFVTYMGYSMYNKLETKKAEYKRQGEKLLEEELDLPSFRLKELYDHQIYTMNELLAAGRYFFETSTLSSATKQLISSYIVENSLEFADPIIVAYDREIASVEAQCRYIESSNSAIKKRIAKKELLLRKLEALVNTNIQLCSEEDELDQKIYKRSNNNG